MTLEGFVKFIFKGTDKNFQYNPSFNTLLPDQSITVESSCTELSVHQYFELFKRFLLSVGFGEEQVMRGAVEVTFHEFNNEELMKKIANEYDLIMAEELPELIEERLKLERELDQNQNEWEHRYHKLNEEFLDLKAKLSRHENPDFPQYLDEEMEAMEHAAEEQNKYRLLKKLQNTATVCHDCGKQYGTYSVGCSSTYKGTCGVCGQNKPVTETRDYGYLQKGINELLNND